MKLRTETSQMKKIYIKTIPAEGAGKQRFGIMIVPDSVNSNEEMYAEVRKCGSAQFRVFVEDNPLELEEGRITLRPNEFEAFWMGD